MLRFVGTDAALQSLPKRHRCRDAAAAMPRYATFDLGLSRYVSFSFPAALLMDDRERDKNKAMRNALSPYVCHDA